MCLWLSVVMCVLVVDTAFTYLESWLSFFFFFEELVVVQALAPLSGVPEEEWSLSPIPPPTLYGVVLLARYR